MGATGVDPSLEGSRDVSADIITHKKYDDVIKDMKIRDQPVPGTLEMVLCSLMTADRKSISSSSSGYLLTFPR